MAEQIQCYLHYPNIWLKDGGNLTVRLMRVSVEEWRSLRRVIEESDLI